MSEKDSKTLKEKILSEENIFAAIYSVESYINERNLLSDEDLDLFCKLKDKYNKKQIKEIIKNCKTLLNKILDKDDEYFKIQVYFKAKKWEEEEKSVVCRPIHTASLITQICIVCLLNQIMFKESKNGKRELSDLSQLLPNNFYGNIPSLEPERIFYDWRVKYKEYTEKVIEAYDEAVKYHKYKYEVALDLKNFFPSVNPEIIYKFCIEKIGYLYQEDMEMLKLVLKKLLKFEITNLKSYNSLRKYYGDNKYNALKPMSVGIPQGLPQSYFFGNLCMTIIYKQFDEIFPGESYFYVDDSIIYTNSEHASGSKFEDAIDELNKKIETNLNFYINDKDNTEKKNPYVVEVHDDEKSISSEIENSQKLSKAYLALVAKEASGVTYDLKTTLDSLEDVALTKKLFAIESAVDKEIEDLEKYEKSNSNKKLKSGSKKLEDEMKIKNSFCSSYKKSLNRYKKFFKYRKHLMKYREIKNYSKLEDEFEEKYFSVEFSDDNKEKIMKNLDADNFLAEAHLIFLSKSSGRGKFLKKLKTFEKNLIKDVDESNLYFSNNFKFVSSNISIYDSLDSVTREKINEFSKTQIDESIEFMEKNLSKLPNKIGYGTGYDKYIFEYSNEYKRRIFNACISRIFNMYLSDDLQIHRKDGRHITYYELCLFSYFRNRCADMKKIKLPDKYLKDEKISYDIYEVLNLFLTYVKEPKYIFQLILMHKYISSIWKNGSRFLYFYTLHNQEHSIELIKRTVSICKVIDYFQIKREDYYILFLCCYLHDVSMAIQPKIDSFTADNEQTDIISSEFYYNFHKVLDLNCYEKEQIKEMMKCAFEKVNAYFEAVARDNHAYNSASFIKNNSDLSYLDATVRNEVASISEAHVYDWKDVYDLKSKARTECISEKYLMILLRLADLVDGAKDRVSLNILRHNISNMPIESQFHWVTHAITDGIEIKSEYEFKVKKDQSNEQFLSVLNKDYLTETIIVNINVNEYNLTNVNCNNCREASAKLDKNEKQIIIEIGKDEKCDKKCCTFLCKWLMTKNSYLLSELNALKLYFDRNASNLFKSKVQIRINFSNATKVSSEYYSIFEKKINSLK